MNAAEREAVLNRMISENGGKFDETVKAKFCLICPAEQVTTRTKSVKAEKNVLLVSLSSVLPEVQGILDEVNKANFVDKNGAPVVFTVGKPYESKTGKNAGKMVTPITGGFGNNPMLLAVDGNMELVSLADTIQATLNRMEQHAAILTAIQPLVEKMLGEATK